jgi:hypothetical protein
MRLTYLVHIIAGSVALGTGYVALFARKGANVHRTSGRVFVYAMLVMATFGFIIAATRGVAPAVNMPAAVIAAYLVLTSLTTVRPPATGERKWLIVGSVVSLATGVTSLTFAFQAVAAGGTRNGMPAFPFFMFGIVGGLASIGDVRILRSSPPRGTARLTRHLWRMCFALFIAALSFFIGQADEVPEPLRIMPLLGLPVLLVLVTMFYWLWRVGYRRRLRGISVGAAIESPRSDPLTPRPAVP